MANFNEHALELSIMELFKDEGYTYLAGEQIHRERTEVLLADEPTGNLDEVSRETIGNIFERLYQNQNKTIILVTHDQKLAETSEKYYRLKDGNLHLRRS